MFGNVVSCVGVVMYLYDLGCLRRSMDLKY